MANRFWVGGTGTWDASNTTSWSTSTGGAGGASVPGTGDVAIFDGASGGGTVTVDSPNGAGVVTVQQITCGAFTGTLDFSANNNNVTLTVAFNGSGSGTRTINLGSGTWTINNSTGGINVWDLSTITGLTFSGASANIVISGNASGIRAFVGGPQSYGSLTIQSNSSRGAVSIQHSNTFGSFSAAAGSTVNWIAGTTNTITNGFALTGTAALPIHFSSFANNQSSTLSLGGTCTIEWGAIWRITKSGAGSLTVNNGLDLGVNSNVTINAPAGGDSSPRIIVG